MDQFVAPRLFNLAGKRVYVAGHRGMVGSALIRRLASENCKIVTATRDQLDLRRQSDTEGFFEAMRPQVVFLAAATVGGILANRDRPADFIYDNLAIELNVIEAARRTKVEKLVLLGSSCIYPKFARQPIREDALLSGSLESTNEPYAVAKIAGIKMVEAYRRQFGCDFISVQPTNLYGPGDNFDPIEGHVPAALIARFHEARLANATSVTVWGTGTPRRDFLWVDDLADACVFLAERHSSPDCLNVGTGDDISIADFARLVAATVGFMGKIVFDKTKPDGTPRKLLDVSRLAARGWSAQTSLKRGLGLYYEAFLSGGCHPRQVTASVD
jgi:GDP-L-fucose synthase